MEVIRSVNPVETTALLVSDMLSVHTNNPVLLLVSGGSWFSVLEQVDTSTLGPWCTLSVLDERFSPDPLSNNFTALTELNFFRDAVARNVTTISTEIHEGDTLASAQARFDHALQAWHRDNDGGVVIALIGVGSDGHIAGIFPEFRDTKKTMTDWTHAYSVTQSTITYPTRITVSRYFLATIVDRAIVYASGDDKREIISKLLKEESALPAPASILYVMRNVTFCTDVV